jgi:glycosyltransferase involved in cell wall biosynthesis
MFASGPISRTFIINKLISENNLKSYLEIGVSNPWVNFLNINCPHKVSVDPCMVCEAWSRESIEQFKPFITHQMTSDEFFAHNNEYFDIVFVDGDHSYEQSLRDLNNAIKTVPVGGFIVLHDAMADSFIATKIENLGKGPYNGGVWNTVVSAIRSPAAKYLQIGTFPYDWGVCVIKKLADNVPEIPEIPLDYYKEFSIPALNPVYDLSDFNHKKVSFFTPLYNTPQRSIERTARTVLNQTNPNWEWVLYDDSSNEADALRLKKFFASLNDSRVKYHRFSTVSGGYIGKAKRRAASLCVGNYLAELDHDDLLMPDIAEKILANGEGFDFIYSNCASVRVGDDDSLSLGEYYGEAGFAMGYGAYRDTVSVNPLTGWAQEFKECIVAPVNPKTIRNIVGMPNHIRVWNRKFYESIGGYNPDLLAADDYELFIRSFLAGGKFLHLDSLGYLQVEYDTRSSWRYNGEITVLTNAIAVANDEKIKAEFELRNMEDWAYKYYHEKLGANGWDYRAGGWGGVGEQFGFGNGIAHYWDVPSVIGADAANCKV